MTTNSRADLPVHSVHEYHPPRLQFPLNTLPADGVPFRHKTFRHTTHTQKIFAKTRNSYADVSERVDSRPLPPPVPPTEQPLGSIRSNLASRHPIPLPSTHGARLATQHPLLPLSRRPLPSAPSRAQHKCKSHRGRAQTSRSVVPPGSPSSPRYTVLLPLLHNPSGIPAVFIEPLLASWSTYVRTVLMDDTWHRAVGVAYIHQTHSTLDLRAPEQLWSWGLASASHRYIPLTLLSLKTFSTPGLGERVGIMATRG
ncbi:hypothetical protein C8Q70DRAFT_166881 [Cubamyces menziesii]|nr:hypothetical protein C8Q70DRAFT_166881 [Cubamyces menziesii]